MSLPFLFPGQTPGSIILQQVLPLAFLQTNPWLENCICSFHYFTLCCHTVLTAMQLTVQTILLLLESKSVIKPGYQKSMANFIPSSKEFTLTPLFKRTVLKRIELCVSVLGAVRRYQAGRIIYQPFQQFGLVLFPALLFFCMLITIVTVFICIRLHTQLPSIMVVVLATIVLLIMFDLVTALNFAVKITLECHKFIQFWERNHRLKRSNWLQLQACKKPIVLWIGIFLPLNEITILFICL